MQIKTILNGTGRTLRIWASENLDVQLHSAFTNAAMVANYRLIDEIEIDLQNTRTIRDSGLALLMMLRRISGLTSDHIKLVNCPGYLQARLRSLAENFHIIPTEEPAPRLRVTG